MSRIDDDIAALRGYFEAGRSHGAQPSGALLARVLADATQAQAAQAAMAMSPGAEPARQAGLWQQVLRGLGGWPALAGLATATVAGIWIGFSPASGIDAYLDPADPAYVVDLDPWQTFDLASMTEGAM
ncbi:MAG: hypothetical protein ACQEVT_00785 [Pseudomonadota bacterium]|uniref:hypothetical protein n=1 Tax=Roseovarius TaxID=74030 RepID=UPI0022A6D99F|nr:hypothetical protein [Roseovarius sp. EGI FJ00037]MCZ0811775.1 hypothetical protein [Roseovarius sp. EGI FJ00037]